MILEDFISRSPTAYHAAASVEALLAGAGFLPLAEGDAWRLEPGAGYYVSRNGSAVVAFIAGADAPAEAGFRVCLAHTDSPALKLRPSCELEGRGQLRLSVELYGSPIVSTWLDRELALAGRVFTAGRSVLVDSRIPVAVVPNLALHFNRDMNKGVEYNPQTRLPALAGLPALDADAPAGSTRLSSYVASLLADADPSLADRRPEDWDLFLYEPTPPRRLGPEGTLLCSGRLDNLAGCHAAVEGLLASRVEERGATRMVALFDNEEVGSLSYQGAQSSFLKTVAERISLSSGTSSRGDEFFRAAARSFVVSVDAAHGWHPSYADSYDERTSPVLGGGPALKSAASLRYATDAEGAAAFAELCAASGVPLQRLTFRSDFPAGFTVGPMTASSFGARTVDVGIPLLAMHSARETCAPADQDGMIRALTAFFSRG